MLNVMTMSGDGPHRINLEELMQGCKKVVLQHGKRPYFLTITRKGNLILTKADEAATGRLGGEDAKNTPGQ